MFGKWIGQPIFIPGASELSHSQSNMCKKIYFMQISESDALFFKMGFSCKSFFFNTS